VVAPSTKLHLRVSPGARRSELVGPHGGGWKVRVAAPAEDGRANEAVLRLLAKTLEVPRRSVTLVSGHGGRDKVVALDGLDADEAARRLGARS
jgi:uncharacterized protein (TIGR00251 family)